MMGVIDKLFRREKKSNITAEQAAELGAKKFDSIMQKNIARLRDKYGVGMMTGIYPNGNPFGGTLGNQVGGAKYPYGLSASGASQFYSHYDMRQNARTAYHDTLQARAMVDRFADCVVDTGLVAESAIDFERLGITAEQAETIGRDLDARFDAWCRSKKQHRARNMTFYQAQRLYEIMQHRDNDMFVRLYYSNKKDLLNPLQFDFIDANQIRGYGWTTTYGPFFQADGILRDDDGVEVGYKVWIQNQKTGEISDVDIPAVGEKSGRIFMLHGFTPVYAGQMRGYSRLGHALQELQNMTDFSLATIKKAINQSNLVLSVENTTKDPSNPFGQLIQGGGGIGPATVNFGSVGAGVTNEELLREISWDNPPEGMLQTPGSTAIANLEQGDVMKMLGNTSPADSYDAFVDSFFSILSASEGIPIEVVLMKFNSNYTAARGALILFWRNCIVWRCEMASDFLDPTREMWLSEEIGAGRLSLPGWSDPRLRAAWSNCIWNGAPMPQIDPAKEAAANKANVELGATTLDRIARDQNGSDGRTNRAKLSRELAELPIPYWANQDGGFGFGNSPSIENPETQQEEQAEEPENQESEVVDESDT